MKIFEVELPDNFLSAIVDHAERDYPLEACGMALARDGRVTEVVALVNEQNRYHALDSTRFPRTAREAYWVDPLKQQRIAEGSDQRWCLFYHSHCDAGAYFSPEDRAAAVWEGEPLHPEVVQLVVSVRGGRLADLAAYRWNSKRSDFDEQRLGPVFSVPDLFARAMEGRPASQPIPPVGGLLVPRAITPDERILLSRRAVHRLELTPVDLAHLACFGQGLYSPLEGFMTAEERDDVLAHSRLPGGLTWRDPVMFNQTFAEAQVGMVVSLGDQAFLQITEVRPDGLAGPVFVEPTGRSAAEVRAELLRRNARRVLAAPKDLSTPDFDVVLSPNAGPLSWTRAPTPWLTAVAAQNQGATHVWFDQDPDILDGLAIVPWRP